MPTIPVQIINHTSANVSVTVADGVNASAGSGLSLLGVTYNQLLNSLGSDVYNVGKIYIYSENEAQISTVITFFIFDSNGDRKIQSLIPTKDPYQYVSSLFYTPPKGLVILNGNSGLQLDILPNTSVLYKFYCCRVSNQGNQHMQNYVELESKVSPLPINKLKKVELDLKNYQYNNEINWLPLIVGLGIIGYIYIENKD